MSWRAWTAGAKRIRTLKGNKRKPPEPIKQWNIVRGDTVAVLSGKDKGKQGKVVAVARKQNRVIVGGLNTHIRVLPALGDFPGGRMLSEAPLHISNVALVDPTDSLPCRVRYKYTEEGERVRVSRRSGMILPKPPELTERKDFSSRSGYVEGPQDTKPEAVALRTFVPSLLSFREEVAAAVAIPLEKTATPRTAANTDKQAKS